jgi:hypothetical protein
MKDNLPDKRYPIHKWEIINDEMTGEYIRSEYRREIIETGGTLDSREEVVEHLMTDFRHNFTEEEANAFYDEALEARKPVLENEVSELMKEVEKEKDDKFNGKKKGD